MFGWGEEVPCLISGEEFYRPANPPHEKNCDMCQTHCFVQAGAKQHCKNTGPAVFVL